MASSSVSTHWDVFLSFRGEDTRLNFVSHLYDALHRNGIRTFKDDPELDRGEIISSALLDSIQNSKIYIVVLSENYASSSWCLDELVEILKCFRESGRLVIPVFYKIDSSVVRFQTKSFKTAFDKHEKVGKGGEMDKANKWRHTLSQVAALSGYHVTENRLETDIINAVVSRVLIEINRHLTQEVVKYPIGLSSRVEYIYSLLLRGTEDVTKIGIYGIGGVGKTTVAKAVYNLNFSRFEGSCFLASVREVSGQSNGRQRLQEQLIGNVLKGKKVQIHSVDQGIEQIKELICSLKLLVVIDDIDHPKEIDYLVVGPFAYGSVIIITTRDEHLLDEIKVEPIYRYKVNELDHAESLQLFTRYAFRNAIPSGSFTSLSRDIVHYVGGLPLALVVFGSNLSKQPEEGWRYFTKNLHRIYNNSIQEKLMLSFDALTMEDPMLMNMFLDIACFFIGEDTEDAVKMMETYYSLADYKINILENRGLISINKENKLAMHDLLQDMAWQIVRNNSIGEPEKHSTRLWDWKDICDVLKKNKGTKVFEGIIHDSFYYNAFYGVSLTTEIVRKMRKLRFLYLSDVHLTGSFEGTFEYLRWLHWTECPLQCLPSDFCLQNLVILELPHSKMSRWDLTMVLQNLKILDVSHSSELFETPDFILLPSLETLILQSCVRLRNVDESIGTLLRLVSLDLSNCTSLQSLPYNMSNLRSLKSLNLLNCSSLEALPTGLTNIELLTEIRATGFNISEFPNSKGDLSKLVNLFQSY